MSKLPSFFSPCTLSGSVPPCDVISFAPTSPHPPAISFAPVWPPSPPRLPGRARPLSPLHLAVPTGRDPPIAKEMGAPPLGKEMGACSGRRWEGDGHESGHRGLGSMRMEGSQTEPGYVGYKASLVPLAPLSGDSGDRPRRCPSRHSRPASHFHLHL
jgi:hypothetical protein